MVVVLELMLYRLDLILSQGLRAVIARSKPRLELIVGLANRYVRVDRIASFDLILDVPQVVWLHWIVCFVLVRE